MKYKVKPIFSNLNFLTIFCMVLISLSGCAGEEGLNEVLSGEPIPLELEMGIDGLNQPLTKAQRTDIDDQWSYIGFDTGDSMGFYASGGNSQQNDGPFNNLKLDYTNREGSKRFLDPDGSVFSPSAMKSNEVYMYFPYAAGMNGDGMELRTSDGKCVDLLSADYLNITSSNKALYGSFHHAFSELIIMRGEGFDNPPYETIKAVINVGCTHIRITIDNTNGWKCVPQLVYDSNNSSGLSEKDSQGWYAWKGGNYGITTEDKIGEEAWYVILPTIGTSGFGRSSVEYIELYDNEGNLQRVSSIKLSGSNTNNPTKYLDSGFRYPIKINMTELGPTVNPYPILPWNDRVDLTDSRERGINDASEFKRWVSDYNAYLADKNNQEKSDALLKYGDKIINGNTGKVSWNFYVLKDIDLTGYVPSSSTDDGQEENSQPFTVIIPKFEDVLDGQSTTLSNGRFLNNKILGLSKTFIGDLTGSIRNFDFVDPDVNSEESSVSSGSEMGIIATSMTSASVSNCNILNGTLLNPDGPAGMVTGKMSGVGNMIQDCEISGFMIYGSTVKAPEQAAFLIGSLEYDTSDVFSGNNVEIVGE